MLTLDQIRNSTVANIAGFSPTSAQFTALVNEAVQRLVTRGDWSDTVVPIRVCVRKGAVVWPRYVRQLRGKHIYSCSKRVPIHNMWFDFMSGMEARGWRGCCGSRVNIITQNRVPWFSDIMGEGRTIRVYPISTADVGKKLILFGEDNNGQPLRTLSSDNVTFTDGYTLTIASPYAATTVNVRRIDRVIKDVTNAEARLYAFNASSLLEDVALYAAGETNPAYLKTDLHVPTCSDCAELKSVVALVKLQHIDAVSGNDVLVVSSIPAIKDMVQSIRFSEAGDVGNAEKFEMKAVNTLNQQLHDDYPEDETPVDLAELANTSVGQMACF